jgi:uncharacterized protein YciI
MQYLLMAMRTPQFQQTIIEAHKKCLSQRKEQVSQEITGPFTDKIGGAYLIAAEDLGFTKAIAFNDPIHNRVPSMHFAY